MESDAEHVDPERDVASLLVRHRALIDEVKSTMANELEAKHDDIFILRYCLSYKTLDKVGSATTF